MELSITVEMSVPTTLTVTGLVAMVVNSAAADARRELLSVTVPVITALDALEPLRVGDVGELEF